MQVKNVNRVSHQVVQLLRTYIHHKNKTYPQSSPKFVSGLNALRGPRIAKRSESLKIVAFSHLLYKGKARPPSSSLTKREKRIKTDLSTPFIAGSTLPYFKGFTSTSLRCIIRVLPVISLSSISHFFSHFTQLHQVDQYPISLIMVSSRKSTTPTEDGATHQSDGHPGSGTSSAGAPHPTFGFLTLPGASNVPGTTMEYRQEPIILDRVKYQHNISSH
jgi:hypothetical protein